MDAQKAKLWVKALRSGEFKQGYGALRSREYSYGDTYDTYCCLGVACQVAMADGVELKVTTTEDGIFEYNDVGGNLPAAVQDWLGIKTGNPILDKQKDHAATFLNDYHKLSFEMIADLIEAEING